MPYSGGTKRRLISAEEEQEKEWSSLRSEQIQFLREYEQIKYVDRPLSVNRETKNWQIKVTFQVLELLLNVLKRLP